MLGTQLLPVADVCNKSQGDGDHVYAGGLDLTPVRALWYLGLSDNLPAWGLRCLGCECCPLCLYKHVLLLCHEYKFFRSECQTLIIKCMLANLCDCASDDIEEEWSAILTVDCILILVLSKALLGPHR